MINKYTTLSKKELELLENLTRQYGKVVDFAMIYRELKTTKSRQEVKNFTSGLVKKGWLVRIKKGVFAISDISGRSTIELHQFTIAQILNKDSYISFEAALQHYNLFDQYLRVITSVSLKKAGIKKIREWTYKFIKAKKSTFIGYKEFNLDGYLIKVAWREKAILDFIVYRRTINSLDLIIEKLKDYKNDFDYKLLIELSQNCSMTTKRTLGFILDLIGIDSSELYRQVKENKNHSFLTAKSNIFNGKWRIYIEKYFKNYNNASN